MQFYTDIIKRSWTITWHHKVLWLFGLFISLWGGKGIEAELNSARRLASEISPLNPSFWSPSTWQGVADQINATGNATTLYLMAVLIGVLLVVVLSIIMLSQIGVIDAFSQFAHKKIQSDRYALHHALLASKKYFWEVLSLNILGKAVTYGLLAVILSPLFINNGVSLTDVWWVLIGLLVYIPISIGFTIIVRYAINDAVLQGSTMGMALRNGYHLFWKNIGVSLELAIIMFFVFVGLVIIVAPVFAAIVTLPSLMLLLADAPAMFGLPWTYLHDRFFLLALLIIIYILSILFSVWHMGSWTMLYQELQKGHKKSKIHRFLNGK